MKNSLLPGSKSNFRTIVRRIHISLFNLLAGSMDYPILHEFRFKILKSLGVHSGPNLRIGEITYIMDGRNLAFGRDCTIGHHLKIYDWSFIHVGNSLFASNGLTIVSATHDPITYDSLAGPITIGDNVWIGINVTLVGPVNIGNNAVIGAGSLVIRDVPENAIVAGIPAKVIRYKNT